MGQTRPEIAEPRKAAPWQSKLGVQLLFGLTFCAVVVAVAAGAMFHGMEGAYLNALLSAENEKKYDLLQSASLDSLISEDLPSLETTMGKAIEMDPELSAMRIVNEGGTVLFAWRRSWRTHSVSADAQERGTYGGLSPKQTVMKDVIFEGERFGTMTAEWDLSKARRDINNHTLLIVITVGLLFTVLGLMVFGLLHAFAVLPIKRISRRVSAFRQGDFGNRLALPVFVSHELQRLNSSVDALGQFLMLWERREVELEAAKDAAEFANRAKTEFLATVSHELRTPLNAINGFSEMMCMELCGPLENDRYQEYVQSIHHSGSHLLSLINDILDIARIEAGKSELSLEDVDLSQLIASCVTLTRSRPGKHNVAISSRIAEDLPWFRMDERRMKQVLLNILSNAVKFTPDGDGVEITARWDPSEGGVIAIADTGIGIRKKDLDVVLEPFARVESAFTREYEGTGLGLPLAKGLVELHGGTFRIDSEFGVGTVVTITLPVDLDCQLSKKVA